MYKGVEHSDTEDSDKSDSSDSEYGSDDEQKTKYSQDTAASDDVQKELTKSQVKDQPSPSQDKEGKNERVLCGSETGAGDAAATASDATTKEKISEDPDKESLEKTIPPPSSPGPREKSQMKEETKQFMPVEDSDSERELVIDLGEEQGGKDKKRSRKDNNTAKGTSAGKPDGEGCTFFPSDPKKPNVLSLTLSNISNIWRGWKFCKNRTS